MKKIFLALIILLSNIFADIGDNGSEVAVDEVKLKVELIKADGSSVTILDGSKYLRVTGSSSTATSIGDSISAALPPEGTYTKIRWTPMGFKIKAKIVKGATTYYTKKITVPEDDKTSWQLTTNSSEYDFTTVTPGSVTNTVTFTFPTPLVISKDKPVNLYYVNKFSGDVEYSGSLPDVTWISNVMETFAFVSNKPVKLVQFDLNNTYNSKNFTNKVSLIYDSNNKLLGAYVANLGIEDTTQNGSLNPAFVLEANQTNNHYSIKVDNDSENNVDYYIVSFDLNSTSFSNASVKVYPGGNDLNGTLTTSGSLTTKDINFAE